MEDTPRSRLTVALAIAAMIAVIGLLVAGVVLAPDGELQEGDEASLVTDDSSHDRKVTEASSAPVRAAIGRARRA